MESFNVKHQALRSELLETQNFESIKSAPLKNGPYRFEKDGERLEIHYKNSLKHGLFSFYDAQGQHTQRLYENDQEIPLELNQKKVA